MPDTLSLEEVDLFWQQGFLGPFQLCSPEGMRTLRPRIRRVLLSPGPAHQPFRFRHLDDPLTYNLCSHRAIVHRVSAIHGDNLILRHSSYFDKPPRAGEIPWHQDSHFWSVDPTLNISAWIAVDDASRENGCLEVLPGSHKSSIPHIAFSGDGRFDKRASMHDLDTSRASISR